MIDIDLWNNSIQEQYLEKQYSSQTKNAITHINKKYQTWALDFLDVDKNNECGRILEYVENNKYIFESVVVLWIWGSALWTKAIFQVLKWKYYNELQEEKRGWYPKLYVLDNVDPIEIKNLNDILNLEKTLFIVISKSGTTIETLSQYKFFVSKIKERALDIKKHFIIITWENSSLKNDSLKNELEVFEIPEGIWWRFSVLTNVWLLPLAFVWIDIKKLLQWVINTKKSVLSHDINKNRALLTAIIQYHSYIKLWNNITILFPYLSNAWFLWEWYKQLIWESLGKNRKWITLDYSLWVTDQHSQLQLYCDGPNDKLIIFLELTKFGIDYNISTGINIWFSDLMNIEKYGTQESINSTGKLTYTIKIDKLDEEILWEIIIFFEMQIAILWELFWINAFNQPWVEEGKKIAKEKIKEKIWAIGLF
jgi:glucose-6-phosphate isomerase